MANENREPVQCTGCPEGTRVVPGRPGHLPECQECEQHCGCFRIPDGIGGAEGFMGYW